ncbi:hypothetical protein, partial [Parabacteroides merdae]|uniref:hypothetical protein n=1 Tax=Parabacteroides merdae TaxID=46503 RepID=UPI0034A4E472
SSIGAFGVLLQAPMVRNKTRATSDVICSKNLFISLPFSYGFEYTCFREKNDLFPIKCFNHFIYLLRFIRKKPIFFAGTVVDS